MFDNIGGKIKGLAKTLFFLGIIAAFIVGIAFMETNEDVPGYGVLIMVLGAITSYIASCFLYGFGQLIENSDTIAEEYSRKNEKHEKVVAENTARQEKRIAEKRVQQRKEAVSKLNDPNVDDCTYIDLHCPNCKATLSFQKWQLQSDEDVPCPFCDAPISL